MFRVTTYARSPEVKSERTTKQKPRQYYGRVVVVEIQRIIFQIRFRFRFQRTRRPCLASGIEHVPECKKDKERR